MDTQTSQSLRVILLIALIVLCCFIAYKIIRRRLKNKVETITCFTGGLGSGKTLLSVNLAIKLYKRQVWKYKKLKFFNKIRKLIHLPLKKCDERAPILLTSIPVIIKRNKRNDNIMSYELTDRHLLLQERIPLGSVVFIDEIGAFASQFDFKEKNITKVFDEFIRFFRHYTMGGYIVCNDQCSENLNYVVRRRITTIHNLANCFVFWRLCFHYERNMSISEEIKTIDVIRDENESYHQDNMDFKIKWLKYRKNYDTYCYSERYNSVPYGKLNLHQTIKCFKLLSCPSDKQEKIIPKTSNHNVLGKGENTNGSK